MPTVSHRPVPNATLWKFKLHHYRLMREGDPKVQWVAAPLDEWFRIPFIAGLDSNISDTSRGQTCPENLFWNQAVGEAI
jgi:hypothetical protein